MSKGETNDFPNVSLRRDGRYVRLDQHDFNVAKMYAFDRQADFANLFAASPELLKFANDFLDVYRSGEDMNLKWFANEAYTAVTKALGKPPF